MDRERLTHPSAQRVAAKAKVKVQDALRESRSRMTLVSQHSTNQNVFHCCVYKTGSQWIRHLLADPLVYKFSGLRTHRYQPKLPIGAKPLRMGDRAVPEPFPLHTIVTPAYISYADYVAIEKSGQSACFFVMRDPRDIVTSWYFSSRYSHRLMADLDEIRAQLASLPQVDGFSYSIRYLNDFGVFSAVRSWVDAEARDSSIKIVRFEDLVGDQQMETFADLFAHCEIAIPPPKLRRLLDAYSFKRRSGRAQGQEDQWSQYRKGIPGDWRTYFDPRLRAEFSEVTNDLATDLGY